MVPSSPLRHLRSLVRRVRLGAPTTHPEAEMPLALPRRIDGPAAAAQLARDLLRYHREEITLVLYLDNRHRLVGTATLAVGWTQAARLSARPVLAGADGVQGDELRPRPLPDLGRSKRHGTRTSVLRCLGCRL